MPPPRALPRRIFRQGFYYSLFGLFLFLTLKPAVDAWAMRYQALADWRLALMLFTSNFLIWALLLEAAVVFWTDRSLARSSFMRLLRFNPSREADLFYWDSCLAILYLGLFSDSALGRFLPDLNLWRIPMPLGALVFVLVMSLTTFIIHYLSHKVPALWELHKIHHSATELTMTTGFREHFVTWGLNNIAMMSLYRPYVGNNMALYSSLMLASAFLNVLQHSSLDFRFGWLGQILVSPHAHRIHHLSDPRYHDRNFGTYITLWDRLLGTFVYEAPLPALEMEKQFGLPGKGEVESGEGNVFSALVESTRCSLARVIARRP